jgi:tetratricopeptide (TPR) repeat protein
LKTQGPVRKRSCSTSSWRPYLATVAGTLLTLGVTHAAGAHDTSELLDARAVLEEIKKNEPGSTPKSSETGQLMAEIRRFRSMSEAPDPSAAAAEWLALFDRASKTELPQQAPDAASVDPDLRRPVSIQSVIAALPGPTAWSALRTQALQRAAKSGGDYHQRGLALLAAVLLGDRAAADADLKAIEVAIASLSPEERAPVQMSVATIRQALTSLYGDPESIARAFQENVVSAANRSDSESGVDFDVPDLVTLVGETESAKILTTALSQPISLRVESGDATRALARRIALEHIDSLKAPQWALVDSIDAAPLYEALSRRFATAAMAPDANDTPSFSSDEDKAHADTYYLLFLIVNGRLQAAQNVLETIAKGHSLDIPKVAIEALQKAQQNEALYAFLGSVLVKHPEVQAWDVYIEQAAYTGHGREALATLEAVLKRTDIPTYLRADLQRRRADALLALDDIPAALQSFDNLLRSPPSATEQFVQQRADSAMRLAGIGRVIGRADVAAKGLRFVEDTLALPPQGSARVVDRVSLLREWFAEARNQHRQTEVQRVAIAEFGRADSNEEAMAHQMEAVGMPGVRATRRLALVELLSLYAAESRYADVRVLLDESESWGARDLRTLLAEKDSLGVPVALTAARALASLGDSAAAIRITRATIFPHLEGSDPRAKVGLCRSRAGRSSCNRNRPFRWRGGR